MFKNIKKSSPDKSASQNKSASLDRSTVNDTGTDQFLAALKSKYSQAAFKTFQDMLEALNQQYGDIQKIRTPLEFSYTEAQDKYKILHDEIKKDRILKPEETKQLLFKTYEYQAISAFRASEFKEHNTHLLHAYKNYGPNIDESIIGLERWVKIYTNLDKDVQTKVPSISEKYNSLLEKVATKVQLLIKLGKHDQARAEMKYLNENSHNFQIFDLYFSTIKDPKEALKYFEDKSKNNLTQRQDIHDILKKWQNYLINQVNDKEVAAYVLKYNSNPTVATAPAASVVNPEIKKAGKDVEKLQEQLEKASNKLETAITRAEHQEQIEKLEATHKAVLKAELEKANAVYNAKLETIKAKASPTKDTKVDEVGDSTTTSSLAPAYTSIPFVEVAKKTPTAPIAKPLDEKVLKELTKLANSITSLNHYEEQYKIDKDKAKSILSEAVKENPDVYKTIDDPKILVLLADVLLSSNKMEKARIVCKKALDVDPNIWEATVEDIVLLNLAGVLLPSDQPKAEQIYSKVMNFRFICKNAQNTYIVDTNRKMKIAKIVAQDGYEDKEKDCLAKVCLGGKVYQKVQALDCYPHTDATTTKRQKIVEQLQQSTKQISKSNPTEFEGKVYALYSMLYPFLKESSEFCQDMQAEYKTHYLNPTLYIYPPTEEYTAKILGLCAANES
ncbi:hypothetical protein [Candidatus Tisiphia endosymbiont of Ptychoptera albimana]|uniref:hypothetical protein n=1 Tax=Candidatus Tisiphia endosymbiont of Ptychoptera albimana TaxID=3066260 RepID=UPI00312C6FC3